MNKQYKKDLIKNYKRKELEVDANSSDPTLSSFAKIELGATSQPLTSERISKTPDGELITLVIQKLEEVVQATYKSNPRKYKSKENVLKEFPQDLKYLYAMYYFEMQLELGDVDKFYENASDDRKRFLSAAYRFLGFSNLANMIEQEEIEPLENEFRSFKKKVGEVKIDFIRENSNRFQLT